jgi:hypothetical protein
MMVEQGPMVDNGTGNMCFKIARRSARQEAPRGLTERTKRA